MSIKNRPGFDKENKDLLDFARSYLSEAFPNPDRQGCPPDFALRSLAFSPTESDPKVTEHLSACSPCFKRYGELLSEFRSERPAEKGLSWMRVSVWAEAHPVLVGTALAAVLFVAIGIGFLLHGIRPPNAPPMDTNRGSNPSEPQPPTVAYSRFDLDLGALSPVRGSAPTVTVRRVSLPNSPLSLTLILPLASPEGPYDLRLAANGQTFWSQAAQGHLHRGKTLIQVDADLRHIPRGNYNLEVRSSAGTRLIQPVSIQAALPNGELKP